MYGNNMIEVFSSQAFPFSSFWWLVVCKNEGGTPRLGTIDITHVINDTRPSPSYCKQSKSGWWEGSYMKIW